MMAVIDPFFGGLVASGVTLVGVWMQHRKTRRMNTAEHDRGQHATQAALRALAVGQEMTVNILTRLDEKIDDHINDEVTHGKEVRT
jgi:urease accessory protein UreF